MPTILGEENMLRKALDLLADNAIKFTPLTEKVNVRLRSEGRFVLIEISDTAAGIP